MKRLKKILAVVSIAAFVFGSALPAISLKPSRVLAAADEEIGAEGEESVDGVAMAVPTGGVVYDGEELGVDAKYFNNASEISANWDGFTTDPSDPIVKYKYSVWRKESGSKAIPVIGWTKTTDNFFADAVDPSPVEGAKYFVKVKARNSCGWSKTVKSNGQILDLTSPDAFSLFLIQNKPYGSDISLSWDASIDNLSGIAEYRLFKNGVEIYSSLSDLTYHDTISGDNLTFNYFVRVLDKAGNFTDSNQASATVDDIAPAAPSISYWIGGKNIVIFWPGVLGASSYEIYRNGILIKSGVETKYTDTNTVRGQTYSYTVYATDEAGNKSSPSNTLSIYIPKPQVSSVTTTGQVQGTTTVIPEKTEQISPSPSSSPSGEVKGSETPAPEETAGETKTNWSLIIAIIIAAGIVISGVLYWWYAREEEEDEI